MSKVKSKKHSVWIDMTAMSDVTVLLLTFFMLTGTFRQKEPVEVLAPKSVSEIKVPENNLLTILVSPKGQIFMNLDKPADKRAALEAIGQEYGITFTDRQVVSFINQITIGVPVSALPQFLDLPMEEQDVILRTTTIPVDSANNQVKQWIKHATAANSNLTIAIKADESTPYTVIKDIMGTLQDLRENRFNLITNLKGMPEGF